MEFSAIPLAFIAGIIGLLSPCVLPMLPAIVASASHSSRLGLLFLASGLSIAFATAGSILTYVLLNAGLSPDILRDVTAVILVIMGATLLFKPLNDIVSIGLSRLTTLLPLNHSPVNGGVLSQFLIGASLGLVWLPCVGPTLGSAIALASQGQNMAMAFTVMLSYGLGSAMPLVIVGSLAGNSLKRLRHSAELTKVIMGIALLILGVSIITGVDHWLEIQFLPYLPDWAVEI